MKDILDISKYQTVNNWSSVKREVAGVIIRLGLRGYGASGTLMEDPKFRFFSQACIQYGIPMGVYFFPTSINDNEALAEAEFILSLVKNLPLAYPIFLDSEKAAPDGTGRSDKLNKNLRTRYLNIIIGKLIENGYNAGVYGSTSWLNNQLDMTVIDSRAYVWVAQYASQCRYEGIYHLWQYRSDGRVSGIAGNVDLSKLVRDMPSGKIANTVIIDPVVTPDPVNEPSDNYIEIVAKDQSGHTLGSMRVPK